MKAKPYRYTPVPALDDKTANDAISRGQLVALLASRLPWCKADDEATVRKRMSAKVDYALRKDHLKPTEVGFLLGDVSFWTSSKWPGCFDDLPKREGIGHAEFTLITISVSGTGRQLPVTLEDAHKEIVSLLEELQVVRSELEKERSRARSLEPDAEAWRHRNRNMGRNRKGEEGVAN